jgi:hypothetical protein
MIVEEFFRQREDGVNLYRTYSDENKYIRKVDTNEEYSEAIDIEGAPYKYEETDKEIKKYEGIEEIEEHIN